MRMRVKAGKRLGAARPASVSALLKTWDAAGPPRPSRKAAGRAAEASFPGRVHRSGFDAGIGRDLHPSPLVPDELVLGETGQPVIPHRRIQRRRIAGQGITDRHDGLFLVHALRHFADADRPGSCRGGY